MEENMEHNIFISQKEELGADFVRFLVKIQIDGTIITIKKNPRPFYHHLNQKPTMGKTSTTIKSRLYCTR